MGEVDTSPIFLLLYEFSINLAGDVYIHRLRGYNKSTVEYW